MLAFDVLLPDLVRKSHIPSLGCEPKKTDNDPKGKKNRIQIRNKAYLDVRNLMILLLWVNEQRSNGEP